VKCYYCEDKAVLLKSSDTKVVIEGEWMIYYDENNYNIDDCCIKYCPMCGRDLEENTIQTDTKNIDEAIEVIKSLAKTLEKLKIEFGSII